MNLPPHVLTALAEIAHEVNRAYCTATGDDSQPAWADAPDWQKSSASMGAGAITQNPTLTPADMHVKWMEQKIAEGWTYGNIKDPERKEHPCMVDYTELPRSQQVKDYLFRAAVLTAAKHIK